MTGRAPPPLPPPRTDPAERPAAPLARLSGWGRRPALACRLRPLADAGDAALAAGETAIARGNGRAYGDAALGLPLTLDARPLKRLLAFDASTGLLEAEAGVLLADVIDVFLPRGWWPTVTPGTSLVTIGGMIAADVHGKNHHAAGSFGASLQDFRLALGDGRVVTCSRDENADLFAATLGGMGLTGVVLSARFRLRPVATAWIRQTTVKAAGLEAAIERLAAPAAPYSVAWIDCLATGAALGRSVVLEGDHAGPDDLPPSCRADPLAPARRPRLAVPVDPPVGLVNGFSVRAFNATYWRRAREGEALVDVGRFFHPLDAVGAWNRIYGRAGFLQVQVLVPPETAPSALADMLTAVAAARAGSFLAVLKGFGAEGEGLLSFPRPGLTLALDIPAAADAHILAERLHRRAEKAGGRVYLAKDSRMTPSLLAAGYPRLDAFRAVRARHGLDGRFRSALSARLGL